MSSFYMWKCEIKRPRKNRKTSSANSMKTVLLVGTWVPLMAACSWMLGGKQKNAVRFFPYAPPDGSSQQKSTHCVPIPISSYQHLIPTFSVNSQKFCLLQLLPSSAPQKRPFAKEIQNLIACRRSTQTYSQKSPNYPQKGPKIVSGFPRKNSLFVSPAAVVWWSQAASELLEKYPWCCSCCCLHKHSDTQKHFAHRPFVTQFFFTEILSKQKHFWTEMLPHKDTFVSIFFLI